LVLGCVKGGPKYTYDDVNILINIESTPKQSNWHISEYKIENTEISFKKIGYDGVIIDQKKGKITENQVKDIGKKIVDAGIFELANNQISKTSGLPEEETMAVFKIKIDKYNKTISIKPYNEQYAPGNLRRVIAEVKGLMNRI